MSFDGRPRRIDHVAIVGAGFSGSLQAINLVRHGGPRATLIERRRTAGRGVAYSAADPSHLLNVRAGNMSALPDDPEHFARWLAAHRPDSGSFAPRLVYGEYLDHLLARAQGEGADGRIAVRHGQAVAILCTADGVRIQLDDGGTIEADAAVLAVGNLPPHEPPILAQAALDADLYAPDPWAADIAEGLEPGATVLTIGTGLTMIDVALLLDARGFTGRIVALSRRGLLPRVHGDAQAVDPLGERPAPTAVNLLRSVRDRAGAVGWRAAVDALRPFTQSMWLAADLAERQRFLRHLRPWWDVHRHRLAPPVAERIRAMIADGRLEIAAGKLTDVTHDGDALRVRWRPRGGDTLRTETVRRIVNCSGPQGDLRRTGEPLLRSLLAAGTIRPDPLHLGIDVNAQSEVVGAGGSANPRLIALGPPTRGTFWEIVAVPDIRVQTWSVARRLANAQWVGGEGL